MGMTSSYLLGPRLNVFTEDGGFVPTRSSAIRELPPCAVCRSPCPVVVT